MTGPAPLTADQMPAELLRVVREVAGKKPARPTANPDVPVLWVGSLTWLPAAVKPGDPSVMLNGDLRLVIPAPAAPK